MSLARFASFLNETNAVADAAPTAKMAVTAAAAPALSDTPITLPSSNAAVEPCFIPVADCSALFPTSSISFAKLSADLVALPISASNSFADCSAS